MSMNRLAEQDVIKMIEEQGKRIKELEDRLRNREPLFMVGDIAYI